jgi:hypothetical protein
MGRISRPVTTRGDRPPRCLGGRQTEIRKDRQPMGGKETLIPAPRCRAWSTACCDLQYPHRHHQGRVRAADAGVRRQSFRRRANDPPARRGVPLRALREAHLLLSDADARDGPGQPIGQKLHVFRSATADEPCEFFGGEGQCLDGGPPDGRTKHPSEPKRQSSHGRNLATARPTRFERGRSRPKRDLRLAHDLSAKTATHPSARSPRASFSGSCPKLRPAAFRSIAAPAACANGCRRARPPDAASASA